MYQDALDVQSACNLSGIARSLARHTEAIWDEARAAGQGTDYVNRHPVVIMFLNQMLYLATGACVDAVVWSAAETTCREKATS